MTEFVHLVRAYAGPIMAVCIMMIIASLAYSPTVRDWLTRQLLKPLGLVVFAMIASVLLSVIPFLLLSDSLSLPFPQAQALALTVAIGTVWVAIVAGLHDWHKEKRNERRNSPMLRPQIQAPHGIVIPHRERAANRELHDGDGPLRTSFEPWREVRIYHVDLVNHNPHGHAVRPRVTLRGFASPTDDDPTPAVTRVPVILRLPWAFEGDDRGWDASILDRGRSLEVGRFEGATDQVFRLACAGGSNLVPQMSARPEERRRYWFEIECANAPSTMMVIDLHWEPIETDTYRGHRNPDESIFETPSTWRPVLMIVNNDHHAAPAESHLHR